MPSVGVRPMNNSTNIHALATATDGEMKRSAYASQRALFLFELPPGYLESLAFFWCDFRIGEVQ